MKKHIDELRAESDIDYNAYRDLLDHCEETHQILLDALKRLTAIDAKITAKWNEDLQEVTDALNECADAIEAASYVEVSE